MTRSFDPLTIKKILIIKWSAMGDCVIASALLDEIREYFPQASIALNVLPPWQMLFENDTRIDTLVNFRMRKVGIKPYFTWLNHLRTTRYDLILDFQTNDKTKILLSIAKLLGFGGRYRAGNAKWGKLYDFYPDNSAKIHAYHRHTGALAKLGLIIQANRPKLVIKNSVKQNVLETAAQLQLIKYNKNKSIINLSNIGLEEKKKFAIFFAGCSPKAKPKRWPAAYYAELGALLKASGIQHVVLIGAQDEAAVCEEIHNHDSDFYINLCEKTELLDIPIWCELSTVNFGNDTGASHLAAAAATPTFVFFGSTDESLSHPIGNHITPLHYETPCRPCFQNNCTHHSCMRLLSPRVVFEKYLKSIS